MKYRKKPVEIEAVQLRWSTWGEVCDLLGDALGEVNPDGARTITAAEASDTCDEIGPSYLELDVRTVHGEIATVRHGDWIIPDGKPGTFYPCKPDIFQATYEEAGAAPAQSESKLVAHAQRELELSGQYAESPQYSESIISAVAAFASYGHSGGSAGIAREQLHRLLGFEALSPLTSDPDEWIDRSQESGYPLWQNKRDSRAFSEDAGKSWRLVGEVGKGGEPAETERATLYGLWRVDDDPGRTGWVTTHEGHVIVSSDPQELKGQGKTEVRPFPEPITFSEWLRDVAESAGASPAQSGDGA